MRLFAVISSTLILAACGGGGGGGTPGATGPVSSTLSFPVASAYSSFVANGYSKSFTISGTCNGTLSITQSAAVGGATFENVSGLLSSVRTQTGTLNNCTPASIAQTSTLYFDTNYVPLGTSSTGTYGVYQTPIIIPATAMVGNTGVLGAMTTYSDSTKNVPTGQSVASYLVEADTANTAIINII